MAYDFRDDSAYKQTKDGMFSANVRSVGWGTATLGLIAGGIKAISVGMAAHAAAAAPVAAVTTGGVGGLAGLTTGAATGAAFFSAATLVTAGWFALGAVALTAAIYAGYKLYHATVDARSGQSDIAAQRNAARLIEGLQKQQQISQSPAQSNDAAETKWRQQIAAQSAAAAQNAGRTA